MFNHKKKLVLTSIILVSCTRLLGNNIEASNYEAVRQKWRKWADDLVIAERDKFLASYGLNANALIGAPVNDFKSASDTRAEAELEYLLKANKQKLPQAMEVKRIAQEIFESDVQILHEPEFNVDGVGVCKHYAKGIVYIMLNCDKHLENIDLLREILRHEYSHVLHSDNINEEITQCLCWMKSGTERSTLEEQTIPYHRAFETRADVYAATTSPDNGKHLKKFLVDNDNGTDPLNYPTTAERIALLEKIEAELCVISKTK